jgi:hypothetical protein
MSIRKKLLRRGLVLLIALILAVTAGCGGREPSDDLDDTSDDAVVGFKKIFPKVSDKTIREEVPKSAEELFAEGARKSLVEALNKSEQLNSARLGTLLSPGAGADERHPGHTESTVTLANTAEPGESISILTVADYDPKTGSSSMSISIKENGETLASGGIYFTDNVLLIKKADVEQPMIRHELDPAMVDSYKSLPALERFMRLLSEPTKPKMSDDEWLAAIDSYLQSVAAIAGDDNYVMENQSSTFAGIEEDCTAITLTLQGGDAADTVRGLAELLSRDPSLKALFVSQDMTDEDSYGITGMDGLLRDLGALTPEERDALNLTFKILLGEHSSALYISAQTGSKSTSLLLRFFAQGYARQIDITFTGFDGGGVKLNDLMSPEGGDNYAGQLVYEDISPGGKRHEYTEVTSQNIITEGSYTAWLEFKYSRADGEDMSPFDVNGTYDYTQWKSGQSITGESSGVSTMTMDGSPASFNVSVALDQDENGSAVNVPQFMEGVGVSTSDPAGLYAALGEGLTQESYRNAPVSTRLAFSIAAMLF